MFESCKYLFWNESKILKLEKMDARVNDFLNEIDEIAPLSENKAENVWEKCYDEESGSHYYWNTKTNEVTWDMPLEYKAFSKTQSKKPSNLYVPPRSAPLFPGTSNIPPVADAIKIYKIAENTDVNINTTSTNIKIKNERNNINEIKAEETNPVQLKDERVYLVSAYEGGSESEDEHLSRKNISEPQKQNSKEADTDEKTKTSQKKNDLNLEKKTLGISLVAGYSDSEEEVESPKSFLAPPPEEKKVSHSTLFPITKPIDVKDFEVSKAENEEGFDSKVFQRKRRIGISLVNTGRKAKPEENEERKGLGFSSSNDNNENTSENKIYSGFKSGGVMFVKADVLNPRNSPERSKENPVIIKDIEQTYISLKEKLGFLSEGHQTVSPVQIMLIQLETLYSALRSGDLKQNYIKNWLEETSSDLIKLEKEATPEGWLLQWDRTHKRYFYQNASTGESQWEYPQADVTVCDEAMDICTTPPPNGDATIHMSPPLPPVIRSPSPPPPPVISEDKNKKKKTGLEAESRKKNIGEKCEGNGEPLPPGVDPLETNGKTKDANNDLTEVLNSFYSDIAAIETNAPNVSVPQEEQKTEPVENTAEPLKKKKKKVKLTEGIAMKKKGVSKLVEKWKNVQMSYND